MGKVNRVAAFLAALAVPAAAVAQDPPVPERRTDATRERQAEQERQGFDTEDGWGIREHRLYVAPAGTLQPREAMEADLPARPTPAWPNEHLYRGWDYANSYSYPQVYPNVGARLQTTVGDVEGETSFLSRFEAELYLLRWGVTFLESVGGERADVTFADADLRIPLRLGSNSHLAILPGVSFPINDEWSQENTNVRLQAIYAFGAHGVGLQLRGGVTEGSREAGLLDVANRPDHTAALYGALVAWRIVPALQLRAEASGEIAAVSGEADRLTVLPGVAFFPWGDPRLQLGLTGVIEWVGDGLDEDPTWGGLFNLGLFFH